METFRLISMTDFVLEQMENVMLDGTGVVSARIGNYANFLKRPLKLEMFVPCDENGNVLDTSDAFRSCEKGFVYSKAKEKVLFELNSPVAVETMNYHIYRNRNIEYLANFGSLELTPTAIKQIGL